MPYPLLLRRLGSLIAVICVGTVASVGVAHADGHRPAPVRAAKAPAKPSAKALAKALGRHARRGPVARAALCATPAMVGDWRNIDATTRATTRVIVDFACGDQVLCDENGNCTQTDHGYYMHPFGKCHPTDCDWGRLKATDMGDGWIRAIYSFGWSTKYVWLKNYSYYGLTYLRVWVYTDFASSDGRTDYTTDEWFLR